MRADHEPTDSTPERDVSKNRAPKLQQALDFQAIDNYIVEDGGANVGAADFASDRGHTPDNRPARWIKGPGEGAPVENRPTQLNVFEDSGGRISKVGERPAFD